MGIISEFSQIVKIGNMNRNEVVEKIKDILSSSDKEIFEELLNNFDKFCKKGNKFPLAKLKDALTEKISNDNFDILNNKMYGLKKVYVTYFHNHLTELIKDINFRNKLRSTHNYENFVNLQKNYCEYLDYDKKYKEETNTKKTSSSYSSSSINYFNLKTDEEKIEYLQTQYEIKFGIFIKIYSYELKDRETEFFKKLVEKEIEEKKEKENNRDDEEDKEKNNYKYSDDNNDDNYYHKNNSDDDNDDYNNNNDYDNYHNYNTYSGYSSHSSHSNYSSSSSSIKKKNESNNYSSKKSSNSTKSNNTKKRVKVILCYSCKSKNRCPLCGIKMGSKVSLGNMYAHENCYNEGTCVLCSKKGPGNQVQSICSNCRKSKSSNGLTGSGRCFICRKLM